MESKVRVLGEGKARRAEVHLGEHAPVRRRLAKQRFHLQDGLHVTRLHPGDIRRGVEGCGELHAVRLKILYAKGSAAQAFPAALLNHQVQVHLALACGIRLRRGDVPLDAAIRRQGEFLGPCDLVLGI